MTASANPTTKRFYSWLLAGAACVLLAALVVAAGAPWLALPLLALAALCGRRWYQGRHTRLDPGAMMLHLSPDPGALQGDVAGYLHSDNSALAQGQLYFRLRCIKVQERYRGQVIEHRKHVCWQARQPAFLQPEPEDETAALRLYFQFSPPPGLSPSEPKPGLQEEVWQHYHYWELTLSGVVGALPVSDQHFRPRVSAGEARASNPLPAQYRVQEASGESQQQSLPESVRLRLALTDTDDGLSLVDGPPARAAAVGWALAGVLLWWLSSSLWLAAPIMLWGLWLAGRNGRVLLRPGHATLIRQWFGRGIYSRNGPLTEMAQLQLAPSLMPPLFSGGEPRYRLRLQADGKQLLLVRDLRSEQEGEQLCRYLKQALMLSS